MSRLFYLIEGPGKAMELVKTYINEHVAVKKACSDFAKSVGGISFSSNSCDGTFVGIEFNGPPPRGWKSVGGVEKRNGRRLYRPRFGSDEHRAMEALPRYTITSHVIAEALGIPLEVRFSFIEGGGFAGASLISAPGNEGGFAFPSDEGPYLLHFHDVQAAVKAVSQAGSVASRAGATVSKEIADFTPGWEGCRKIMLEEWTLIEAQHALDVAKAKAASDPKPIVQ